jgi:hypothetical protein
MSQPKETTPSADILERLGIDYPRALRDLFREKERATTEPAPDDMIEVILRARALGRPDAFQRKVEDLNRDALGSGSDAIDAGQANDAAVQRAVKDQLSEFERRVRADYARELGLTSGQRKTNNAADMAEISREELEARLETVLVRNETAIAKIDGKIDVALARMDERFASILQRLEHSDRETSKVKGWIIGGILTILFGVAGINFGLLSALGIGRDIGAQPAEQNRPLAVPAPPSSEAPKQ